LIDSADITLRTTLERISEHENLDIVKRFLKKEKIRYNEYDTFSSKLRLAGAVVRDEDGFCKIRNPIYQSFLPINLTFSFFIINLAPYSLVV